MNYNEIMTKNAALYKCLVCVHVYVSQMADVWLQTD